MNFSVEIEKPDNTSVALLDDSLVVSPKRYPTSELQQFWVVLKRTLLFSRRDWVNSIMHIIFIVILHHFLNSLKFFADSYVLKVVGSHFGWIFNRHIILRYRQ